MKIILINSYYSPVGGAEIIAYNTYKLLKEAGHEIYFWGTDYQPYIDNDYEFIKYFTKYKGTTKDFLKNPFQYFYNKNAKKDLEKFINLIKPDIIHIHSLDFITGSILDCCRKIPTVYTVHGANLFCPTGLLMLKNKQVCDVRCKNNNYIHCVLNKCAKNKLEPSIRRALMLYVRNKNLDIINKFITPSYALKELIIKANIGIEENKITVINNYIAEKELETNPNYLNKGYFLYAGRLSKEKGTKELLSAMSNLPREISLHIAGTGNEENNLKQYAKENNLHNVHFLGFLDREHIKIEYQNCIATILPSNCFDNFPTCNIESFAYGKPVIASNIGGIPEQVEHGKTGLIFKVGDIEQLKQHILTYWENNDLVLKHGENAFLKANKQYNEKVYLSKIIKIYQTLIDERNMKQNCN